MQNKTLGSTLIVAGITIGAGMLAMPLTSAQMGFPLSVILLIGLWLLLSYSALLFVEAYQKAPAKDAGIAALAEQYFGILGRIIATVVLVLFMYAILVVYALGGGNILKAFVGNETASICLFVVVFGLVVTFGTKAVDGLTRGLFALKLVVFALVLFLMLPKASLENLGNLPLNYALFISASPIFFTSFGFHVVIPSINKYLDGDVKLLKRSIILGTSLPLIAYIIWQLATHGVFPQSQFVEIINADPTLNGLVEATKQVTGSTLISSAVRIFSAFALITSFLGVALSLVDTLDDLLKRVNISSNRTALSLLTFVPTLLIALFYTNFLSVLSYAGQMFTFYGLILPIAIVWKLRKQYPNLPYRVAGGNLGLVLALILGLLIMNVPFLISAGYLPPVAG